MVEQSLKERTAISLLWSALGSGMQQILGLVFGIVLARILSSEDYGIVGMLAIFLAISNIMLESGFITAIINKKEISHNDYNAVFWFSLGLGTILYIILFVTAPYISKFYEVPELTKVARILFLSLFTHSLNMTYTAYLLKNLMIKEKSKVEMIALFISGTVGVILALNNFSYWSLVFQTLSYSFICLILRFYYTPWRPTLQWDFSPIKEMYSSTYKLVITYIFAQISQNIFSVILGKFYNEKTVGYYSQGHKWNNMGSSFINGMLNSLAQPILVKANNEKIRQKNILRKFIRFGAFVSFPLMFGLAFVGKEFIVICLTEKWLPSVIYMQIFCIWGAFSYIWILYTNLLFAHGKFSIYMWGTILFGFIQLSSIFLTFKYGIVAMLITYILCFFAGTLGWHYFINKLVGISLSELLKDILPYLGLTFISLGGAWFISKGITNLYLLISLKIIVTALLYIILLWIFNSHIFKESINFILKRRTE